MRASWIHWVFGTLLGAAVCAACGSGGRVTETATPYVRCPALEPPDERSFAVGPARLAIAGRTLEIAGLELPLRLVAFSDPGFGGPPPESQLAAVRAADPQLVLVLGGLGEAQEAADATAAGLASLGVPVLVVAGGRDRPERIERAIRSVPKGGERIVDVTTLRTVQIGNDTLIPVAGAEAGRYALGPDHCGYALSDLKDIAGELGSGGEGRRWLLAWQAPGQPRAGGVARTEAGIDLGSADMAELARRVGAPGGLFAWPAVQAGRPSAASGGWLGMDASAPDLRLVVPRLSGMPLERDDGSHLMPGFALLKLGSAGLSVVEILAN